MKVYDKQTGNEAEYDKQKLVDMIANENRQVDLFFAEKKTDEDGYLSWNQENWVSLDGKRFVCSYFTDGRALNDYAGYNSSDIENYFFPEKAVKVELN